MSPVAPTSPALRDTLEDAARALNLTLSPGQLDRLIGYLALLQRWNAIHNLSASNAAETLLHQHLVDCLAIVPPLAARIGTDGVQALDAGTGAGLPAFVLATAFPNWTVTAVDSVAKKIAFLRQAAGDLDVLNLRPVHSRLDQLALEPRCDVVTARAFASLGDFVRQTHHLLHPTGFWAAMKGKRPDDEIRSLPPNCQLFHVEPLHVPGVAGTRCLVWLKPKPAGPADH